MEEQQCSVCGEALADCKIGPCWWGSPERACPHSQLACCQEEGVDCENCPVYEYHTE